jgi:hypothetical protein
VSHLTHGMGAAHDDVVARQAEESLLTIRAFALKIKCSKIVWNAALIGELNCEQSKKKNTY